jgi:hypothetical protein
LFRRPVADETLPARPRTQGPETGSLADPK